MKLMPLVVKWGKILTKHLFNQKCLIHQKDRQYIHCVPRAASQPACPAPITAISYSSLFSHTEFAEYFIDQIFSYRLSGYTSKFFVDTAGIRDTEDVVEKIGVDRAKENAKDADLIMYVIDASAPLEENDDDIMRMIHGRKAIILLNKADLNTILGKDEIKKKYSEINQLYFQVLRRHPSDQ